ncbi:MAG: BREX system P-loop protein BrxC [Acidobacteria bacterium]|nr:BREX system P-loop protein BrxC [Acidobacteriota bacterium]
MKQIAELFERSIDRRIEEVIKVDQDNERAVVNEIDEYVATDSIRTQFQTVLKEIAEGPSQPREGIGVWVSGFFGSGKSSFAKILGYTLANRTVGGSTSASLFKKAVRDQRIADLVDSINARIPFEAVIFDVSMERGVRSASDRLTEIMYRALLRQLGYAEDFDLAELEITLESDGKLAAFETEFERLHDGEPWKRRRQMGLAVNEASFVLHRMNPEKYPSAESFAASVGAGRADVDPKKLASRTFDLAARRAPGKAMLFIVDEVGQFVARSVDKMLDLMGIVQALGVEGRNRTERREVISPCWLVVTSQEKLNEVVTALDSKRIELARLMDRFPTTVDLKQADISEVTAKRVLAKRADARELLEKVYDAHSGRIRECCSLERSARNLEIDRASFVRLYPYLPYQIELCIDIVSGLRLKRGAHRHVGGSNRTIISQAQQMMINDRTRLADAPVGHLVTLDRVYELLEAGNLLPSETSREIATVATRLQKKELALKVVKAIALLESVKDLPRTPQNLAVVLHPAVDAHPLLHEIEAVLEDLEKAQFIRNTDEGYKLLTVQEKNWETRRSSLDPREADRNRIHREVLAEIFADPRNRSLNYKDIRTFRLAVAVESQPIDSSGDVPFHVQLPVTGDWQGAVASCRTDSASRPAELFWICPVEEGTRDLVTELFRSREMIAEYERLGSQNRLTNEESTCLSDEKNRRDLIQRKLRESLLRALESGVSFFQGVERPGRALGAAFSEMAKALLDLAIPVLYPKLETGNLPLGGSETEKFLTAVNLAALPKVFHDDVSGKSLVVKQGGHVVPNLGCDLSREILEYLRREHSYGNKVTGKMLENHFAGLGYGWNLESVRLGLALLFRGGAVEVGHQGRKYRHYSEPPSRQPFLTTPAFRTASFSPREALDLKVLAAASRMYEELTGREVNIEEGEIALAFKQAVAPDREKLLPLLAQLRALGLPGSAIVQSQLDWVQGISEAPADDCVKTLATEGRSFLEGRRFCEGLERAATEPNIATVQTARRVLQEQWPVLSVRGETDSLQDAKLELDGLLVADDCLQRIESVRIASSTLSSAYRKLYVEAFDRRRKVFATAIEAIRGQPEWLAWSAAVEAKYPEASSGDETAKAALRAERDAPLSLLLQKAGEDFDLPEGATVCRKSGATIGQLESETAAVEIMAAEVLRKLDELAGPKERIERVAVARQFQRKITNKDELEDFLRILRERLEKALSGGSTIVLE